MSTNENPEQEVAQLMSIPFMPNNSHNIQYRIDWWSKKSIPDVEDKGGSFNLNLYLQFLKYRNDEFNI